MKNEHVSSIDFLRGFAALMVCVFHFAYANKIYLVDTNYIKQISQFGYLGVYIFFVISGFVIPYSMFLGKYKLNYIGLFTLKRSARIWPPYICSIVLVLLLGYMATLSSYYRGVPFKINYFSLFSHLFYATDLFGFIWINPVYWTLAIEFQYYILIGVVFVFLANNKIRIQQIFVIAILCLLSYLIKNQFLVFKFLPVFILGISIFQKHFSIIKNVEFIIISTIASLFIYLNFPIEVLLASLTGFFAILFLKIKLPFSSFLGDISYSIFLIHIPIGAKIINFSENFIHSDFLRTLFVFFVVAICIISAKIFYQIIEKPSIVLSKNIQYH
jgi:peptidoglycan/LPS O-acetylase OafA/YrhL